jgi:hypothetical protein
LILQPGTGRSFGVLLDSQTLGNALFLDEYLDEVYIRSSVSFVAPRAPIGPGSIFVPWSAGALTRKDGSVFRIADARCRHRASISRRRSDQGPPQGPDPESGVPRFELPGFRGFRLAPTVAWG